VKLYIVRRLPQMDAAAEIGVDRKTISRRLPHIYNIARRLTGKTDKEKAAPAPAGTHAGRRSSDRSRTATCRGR